MNNILFFCYSKNRIIVPSSYSWTKFKKVNFVFKFFSQSVEGYLGMDSMAKSEVWVWQDSGVLATYTNWGPRGWLGDCARMKSTGIWDDVYCYMYKTTHPIECEKLLWL